MKVFLGGTVNGSTWRDEIIPHLKVNYFNPVVDDWNEEARLKEISERESADFSLYVITPLLEGFYSIAEVSDDSFKKADKTLFCYLEEDQGKRFSADQLIALNKLGKLILSNGGIWKKNLNEVVKFLNSSTETVSLTKKESSEFRDIFISYGRRHSLVFARKLFYQLSSQGYKVWFDMNDIPLGVDFQEQIDEGIKKADNFIFIISPHSVNSVYCYKEIELAKKYNKRIIPILHIEPGDLESKIHPEIRKRNWIYARQKLDLEKNPEDWEDIDDINSAINNLIELGKQHKKYVHAHTILLNQALSWVQNKRNTKYLLRGTQRKKAINWLLTKQFKDNQGNLLQAPCGPIALQAEFIITARKNSENNMTDCFLAYAREDIEAKELLRNSLNLRGISSWSDTHDIPRGAKFKEAIEQGIAGADCLLFLISPYSVNSKDALQELDIAIRYKKRLIPLLITTTEDNDLPIKIRSLQYIDFLKRTDTSEIEQENTAQRQEKKPFETSLDLLEAQMLQNKYYFYLHKLYLFRALRWIKFGKLNSMLLSTKELENALAWSKLSKNQHYKSNKWQDEYIENSQIISGTLDIEIYIAFAEEDTDFTREINDKLQISGKTTYFNENQTFDESNFIEETENQINKSNNFVFILSKSFFSDKKSTKTYEIAKKRGIRMIAVQIDSAAQEIILSENIQKINFDSKDIDSVSADLIRILETDKEHNRLHNYFARSAKIWENQNKNNDYLLRGQELEEAQNWLKKAEEEEKTPKPTSLHHEYINRSSEYQAALLQKEKQQKRVKLLLIFSLILGAFATIFGFFAYQQSQKAKRQTILAKNESIKAKKMELLARSQADSAQHQRKLAEIQKHIAEEQKKEALQQKQEAIFARRLADSSRFKADIQRQRALFLAAQAKRNEYYANEEKEKAQAAEEKAQYYLYAFNAKNFANEALSTKNKRLKIFLSTTALELNYVADSLSQKYGLQHPYMPILLHCMQNTYSELYDTHLTERSAKAILTTDSLIYTATTAGRLDILKLKIKKENVEFDSIQSLYTHTNDLIYSIIQVNKEVWLNTSGGEIFKMVNGKLLNSTSYFPNGVSKITKLPTAGLIQTTDNLGNSTIIDTKRLGNRSIFGRRFLEGKNLELKILKRFNNTYDWNSSNFQPNIIAYNENPKLLFINSGRGDILYVDKKEVIKFPQKHGGMISCIAISHNHKWLASGSFDGTILIWNINNLNPQKIQKLIPILISDVNTKYINSLSFSPDDNFILYSNNEAIEYLPIDKKFLYLKLKKEKLDKKQNLKWWYYYRRGDIQRKTKFIF